MALAVGAVLLCGCIWFPQLKVTFYVDLGALRERFKQIERVGIEAEDVVPASASRGTGLKESTRRDQTHSHIKCITASLQPSGLGGGGG